MKNYSLKKIHNSDIKYFSINLGLMPGYTKSTEYLASEVIDFYQKYMQIQFENNAPVFPVNITPGHFVYGFVSANNIVCNNEGSITIHGEIIREYHSKIFNNDEKLLDIITEIAKQLGNKFEQERVHLKFQNVKYILE